MSHDNTPTSWFDITVRSRKSAVVCFIGMPLLALSMAAAFYSVTKADWAPADRANAETFYYKVMPVLGLVAGTGLFFNGRRRGRELA